MHNFGVSYDVNAYLSYGFDAKNGTGAEVAEKLT